MALRALSAAATIFSKKDQGQVNSLINLEAREALRVVALAPGDKKFFNMREGYFRGADFPFACLAGADLEGTNFEGANLYRANMFGAALRGARFSGANLAGIDLRYANIKEAVFDEGQNFADWRLKKRDRVPTELSGAMLCSASLDQANFKKSDLSGVSFDDAYGERISMDKSCLFHVSFKGVSLSNSSVIGFDARCSVFRDSASYKTKFLNVDFSSSNLKGADFQGIDLTQVVFYGANFRKANFRQAKIYEKSIAGAYLCHTIWVNGEERNDSCKRRWRKAWSRTDWKTPPAFVTCPRYEEQREEPSEADCEDPKLRPPPQCYKEMNWFARIRSVFSMR